MNSSWFRRALTLSGFTVDEFVESYTALQNNSSTSKRRVREQVARWLDGANCNYVQRAHVAAAFDMLPAVLDKLLLEHEAPVAQGAVAVRKRPTRNLVRAEVDDSKRQRRREANMTAQRRQKVDEQNARRAAKRAEFAVWLSGVVAACDDDTRDWFDTPARKLWLKGKSMPSLSALAELADRVGVELDDVLVRVGRPPSQTVRARHSVDPSSSLPALLSKWQQENSLTNEQVGVRLLVSQYDWARFKGGSATPSPVVLGFIACGTGYSIRTLAAGCSTQRSEVDALVTQASAEASGPALYARMWMRRNSASVAGLAAFVGITEGAAHRLVKNRSNTPELAAFARALGVPAADMFEAAGFTEKLADRLGRRFDAAASIAEPADFAVMVRAARRGAGLTAAQVGALLGYQDGTFVSKVESGASEPSLEQVTKFVRVLRLDPSAALAAAGFTSYRLAA